VKFHEVKGRISLARLDQYYTKRSTAQELLKKLSFDKYDYVLEPSAGDGAFFDYLPEIKRIGIDLDPPGKGVIKQDFFTFKPESGKSYFVVGNPPFGKNASLAKAFFNYSAQFADKIAFIVPRTFRKYSLTNRLDRHFWLVHEESLPKNSFRLTCGKEYDVPCVFQLWEKRKDLREIVKLPLTHNDFEFTDRSNASFAIRRVGVNAGKVFETGPSLSVSSHYFIKGCAKTKKVFQTMWEDAFSKDADPNKEGIKWDTAGNPSLSKRELVSLYEDTRG